VTAELTSRRATDCSFEAAAMAEDRFDTSSKLATMA
jgi:hypothetical protein